MIHYNKKRREKSRICFVVPCSGAEGPRGVAEKSVVSPKLCHDGARGVVGTWQTCLQEGTNLSRLGDEFVEVRPLQLCSSTSLRNKSQGIVSALPRESPES